MLTQLYERMRDQITFFLDNTSQAQLFVTNLFFSAGMIFTQVMEDAKAWMGFFVAVVLVGVLQIMKGYRDHVTWLRDEEFKRLKRLRDLADDERSARASRESNS